MAASGKMNSAVRQRVLQVMDTMLRNLGRNPGEEDADSKEEPDDEAKLAYTIDALKGESPFGGKITLDDDLVEVGFPCPFAFSLLLSFAPSGDQACA